MPDSWEASNGLNPEDASDASSDQDGDGLDAEQELLDAKVSLVGADRDQVVASFQLQEAIGQLTAKNLALPVKIYNPLNHYKEIRSKWFGSNSSGQNPGKQIK